MYKRISFGCFLLHAYEKVEAMNSPYHFHQPLNWSIHMPEICKSSQCYCKSFDSMVAFYAYNQAAPSNDVISLVVDAVIQKSIKYTG